MNPPASNIVSNTPPQTSDVLRRATKAPSPQSTTQPRVAANPPSIQHTQPTGNTNQQEVSTPKSAPSVHTIISQSHSVISDKPIMPPGLGIII